jgi:hypothetical protein
VQLSHPNPTEAAVLARRLRVVARVAAGAVVRQHEPKVRARLNRNLVIGVEMTPAARKRQAQLFEDVVSRRQPHPRLTKDNDAFGLPAAIHTPPLVALKAQHPKPPMIPAITAIRRLPTWRFRHTGLLMRGTPAIAVSRLDERAASRRIRAWALCDCGHPTLPPP